MEVDLTDFNKLEILRLDHPKELETWLNQQESKKSEWSPIERVRLFRIKYEISGETDISIKELDALIESAKNLGLTGDVIILLGLKILVEKESGTLKTDDEVEQAMRQVILYAKGIPGQRWDQRIMINLCHFLHERGRDPEALAVIQEAYKIIKADKLSNEVLRIPILLYLSTMLIVTGQSEEVLTIFEEIQSISDRYKLRFVSQRNLYNIGKHLTVTGPTQDIEKAASYTYRSLELAKDLDSEWDLATVHDSLITIERHRKNYAESINHARTAFQIFEKFSDKIWMGDAQMRWGETLLDQNQLVEALEHIDKASQLFPPDYKRDQASLMLFRSRALQGMGQFERALHFFQKYHKEDSELSKEKEKSSYAASKVRLGLQLEEEKNRALKTENALNEQKLKTGQLYKLIGFLSILSVFVLSFLAIRLHRENVKISELQDYIHRGVLLRFLPPFIVEEIISGRSRLESEPKEELVTVIFADIVNFTLMTEHLGVSQTASILNRFLHVMTEVIFNEGGTIDKFIGDAVMILYGAPSHLQAEEQARKAIGCALAMREAIDKLSEELLREFDFGMEIRIGINQGRAIVGTFGGIRRSDFTAIGPAVNLASRIVTLARPQEILVSDEIARLLPGDRIESRGFHVIKGYEKEIELFSWKEDVAIRLVG